MSKKLSELIDPQSATEFKVYDLFDEGKLINKLGINENLSLMVNPSGSVRMVKVIPTTINI